MIDFNYNFIYYINTENMKGWEKMKTILVCNQKGGVGKSLIADELAYALERANLDTGFADLDGQGGTLHRTREGGDVTVVDTPGALSEDLDAWLNAADVAVVPTRTTSRDITPLLRMRDVLAAHPNMPVVYVLNSWNRFNASRDFLDWFYDNSNGATICRLPQAESFVQAAAAEKSVVDFAPKSKAAQAVEELSRAVFRATGITI